MFDVEWMNKAEDYDNFFDFTIQPNFFYGEVSVETDEGGVEVVPFATSTWTNESTMYIYMYINGNWEGFWIPDEYLPKRLQDCFEEDDQEENNWEIDDVYDPYERSTRKNRKTFHKKKTAKRKKKIKEHLRLRATKEKEHLKSAFSTMETDLTMTQAKYIADQIFAIKKWVAREKDAIYELQLKLQYRPLSSFQREEIQYMISDLEAYIEDEEDTLFFYENNIKRR